MNDISTIEKIRNRPRFMMKSLVDKNEYSDNLKAYLKSHPEFSGSVNTETAIITVNNGNNSYWKPQLSLRSETEAHETVIRGIFGPSSAVWTFFMFLYFIFSILWMVFITFWFVGKQIKTIAYEFGLFWSFVMLGGIVLTYAAAKIGYYKSKNEMQQLKNFAVETLIPFENNNN